MRHTSVIVFLYLIMNSCCHDTDRQDQQNLECVNLLIEELAPYAVYKEVRAGSSYYFFQSQCCDQYDFLYDVACNYICAPSGGLHGDGDKLCNGFPEPSSRELFYKMP